MENPNPSWTITIQPILTNGDSSKNGRYLTLGDGTKVDTICFNIDGINNRQFLELFYQSKKITNHYSIPTLELPFEIDYDIFNPISNSTLRFCLLDNPDNIYKNSYLNSNPFGDTQIARISDPILNLFRKADLITIALFDNYLNNQVVFYGAIEDVDIDSSSEGTFIDLKLGAIGNILNKSMLVNSTNEQTIDNTLAFNLSQQVQLGTLITQLIEETYISQLGSNINYYGGRTNNKNENIASGKVNLDNLSASTGSGLNSKSYVYASTPPMDNKLDVILQTLYPYNRVFYVDLNGDFTITPLQNYFDSSMSWKLDISGQASSNEILDSSEFVPILRIQRSDTANVNNRINCVLMQSLTQFVSTNTDGSANNVDFAQTIATPPQDLFPREYDMVTSQLGVQTAINLQSINTNNVAQNSGLINTALGAVSNNIQGMYTKMVLDGTQKYITTANADDKYKDIKNMTALYAARSLAESLKDSMLIDVIVPLKYTYLPNNSQFRTIPINQLVQMPPVHNNVFDGQQFMFCYGFKIIVTNYQSLLILKLCKPFTYTGLWCDQAILIDTTSFGATA